MRRKKPGDPLVFGYRHLPYGKFAISQIVFFPLVAIGVAIYFQWFSKWRGGFIHHSEAFLPVFGFLILFLVLALMAPVRDLLTQRNERVEIHSEKLLFFNFLGKKRFEAPLKEITLLRAGRPITSKVHRYIYMANGKSFFFSADIENLERLLKILGTEK